MAIKPCGDKKIDGFIDYILNNYVNDDAKFALKMSYFENCLSVNTNRESLHTKSNAFFHSKYSNIFILIDNFLRIHSNT